jgi:type I restriction enzyme S subunit
MSEMKFSGTQLIGNIPAEWDVKPLKYCVDINKSVLIESTPPLYEFRYDDIGSVTFTDGITGYEDLTFESAPSRARRIVHKGDTIVSTVRTYLKAIARIVDDDNVIVSTGFAVLATTHVNDGFLEFFCKSEAFCEEIDKQSFGIAYPAVNSSQIGRVYMPVPSLPEQHDIAVFLDDRCGYIDGIISDLERQVELLRQCKKALITETVTKGLDKKEKWTRTKIKFIGTIKGRIGYRGYTVDDTVDPDTEGCAVVMGGTNIMRDGSIDYEDLTFLSEFKYFESPEIMLKGKEILITKVGAGTGENAMYDGRFERATINPTVMILVVNKDNSPEFVNYLLLSEKIKEDMKIESTKSGAQPAINQAYVNNVVISIPTLNEQSKIVEFLDSKCSETDGFIAQKQKAIDTMRQYKKSLIYEYVTGKKRVAK